MPPAWVMRNSAGRRGWRWITASVAVLTIQPTCQPPAVAQSVSSGSADATAQSVIGALRLIASLRASCVLPTMSLAKPLSLLPSEASLNDGTARPTRIARIVIATMSSISVNPRDRGGDPRRGFAAQGW
jgi:hypothetical protein